MEAPKHNQRPAPSGSEEDDAFVSYSRVDGAFVRSLHAGLEARGRRVWVDWDDIAPTESWADRILKSIDNAQVFVFVISPDSLRSTECMRELERAVAGHKRLIPVLHRDPEDGQEVPAALAALNYVFARDAGALDGVCQSVSWAIDTDPEWLRVHTRWLMRAREWEHAGEDAALTLRGRELDTYEGWSAQAADRDPTPSNLQQAFLLASRRAVTRRARTVLTAVAFGLLVIGVLGTLSYVRTLESRKQSTIATARGLINEVESLRTADDRQLEVGDTTRTLRAAARAMSLLDSVGERAVQADMALRAAYHALPEWHDIDLGRQRVDAAAFSPGGSHLIVASGRRELSVWDTAERRRTQRCPLMLGSMESVRQVAISDDGRILVSARYDAGGETGGTSLIVRSATGCEILGRQRFADHPERVRVSTQGDLITYRTSALHVLHLTPAGLELASAPGGWIPRSASPSPDGERYAVVERQKGVKGAWLRVRSAATHEVQSEYPLASSTSSVFWPSSEHVAVQLFDDLLLLRANPLRLVVVLDVALQDKAAISPQVDRLLTVGAMDGVMKIRSLAPLTTVARVPGVDAAAVGFAADGAEVAYVDKTRRRLRFWRFGAREAMFAPPLRANAEDIAFVADGRGGHRLLVRTPADVRAWEMPQQVTANDPFAKTEGRVVDADRLDRWDLARGGERRQPATSADEVLLVHRGNGERRRVAVDGQVIAARVDAAGTRLAVIIARASTRGGSERRLDILHAVEGHRLMTAPLTTVLNGFAEGYLELTGADQLAVVLDGGSTARLLRLDDLREVARVFHPGLREVVALEDGRFVATYGTDELVRIWDVGRNQEVARISSPLPLRHMALSADGRWLGAVDEGGRAVLWPLWPRDLIALACDALGSASCP